MNTVSTVTRLFGCVATTRWTFRRNDALSALASGVGTTPCTRWPSTRRERARFSPKESVVTTTSKRVTEGKPNLFSTRRWSWVIGSILQRFFRIVLHDSLCLPISELVLRTYVGKNYKEGSHPFGMHRLQVQVADGFEALQALWARREEGHHRTFLHVK